jgi:hypothetical protein
MGFAARHPLGTGRTLHLKVILALYVLAAALLPFAHHDLACHLKSTTHCATCQVGSSGEVSIDPAVLGRLSFIDAGSAVGAPVMEPGSATIRPASGRAPPATA